MRVMNLRQPRFAHNGPKTKEEHKKFKQTLD